MANVTFFGGEQFPLEMHKVRVVQKLNLPPVERRLEAIKEAGNNTFLLKNKDIFLDMLTDSGVNAMSDQQMAAMMICDDSYAGSSTFTRLAHPRPNPCFPRFRCADELPFYHHQSPYHTHGWPRGGAGDRRRA